MVPEPLQVSDNVWPLIGVLVTALLVFAANRLSGRADDRQKKVQNEVTAGSLALDLAKEVRTAQTAQGKRLDRIEKWRRNVLDVWWPAHERHDRAVDAELLRHDPTFVIPDRIPLPDLEDEDAEV